MKNLEGLPFPRDRRLKPTNYDLQLNQIALSRHTTYPLIFTEALELFLKSNKARIGGAGRVTVPGSDDWLFVVTDTFHQLTPANFGAANTRALYRRAVGEYLESQAK